MQSHFPAHLSEVSCEQDKDRASPQRPQRRFPGGESLRGGHRGHHPSPLKLFFSKVLSSFLGGFGGIVTFRAEPFRGPRGSEGLTRRKADLLQCSTSCCPQAGPSAQESLAGGRAEHGAIRQRRMSAAVPEMQWCPEEPLAVMMMGI